MFQSLADLICDAQRLVVQIIKRWRFPAPADGQPIEIAFPLVFRPGP